MKVTPLLFTFLLFFSLKSRGQDTLFLQNPSFETASANCSEMPAAWINRGSKEEAAPSVQPGCLEVSMPAFHGRQYLSLVTRKNGNCDIVGQKFSENARLIKDSTYYIRLSLAHSENLKMPKKSGKRSDSYDQGAVLQLWGLNSKSKEEELLAETPPVKHGNWRGYYLILKPTKADYDEIQLEAAFNRKNPMDYNGNVLVDSISAIVKTESVAPLGYDNAHFTLGAEISLNNPSFEDMPRCCEAPRGWYSCGPAGESPSDIQPGSFMVSQKAYSGDSYVGMIVRDNGTSEAIGQRLPEPLQVGQTYVFQAQLARSQIYLSLSRATGEEVNYATPVKLRVWGGSGDCEQAELLAESPSIIETEWNNYQFKLRPQKGNHTYLILEACYKEPILFYYNGNLLIDDISLHIAQN